MKAAALVGLRKIEIQEKAKPAIQSGEVLVKVAYWYMWFGCSRVSERHCHSGWHSDGP